MSTLYVVNARTGQSPEPAMLTLLCNGDVSTKLTRAGLDVRPHFEARASVPVQFRFVEPEHGHYAATLYVGPTRRERIASWWRAHYRALFWLLVPWVSVFLAIVALELLKAGGDMLADWISARWT